MKEKLISLSYRNEIKKEGKGNKKNNLTLQDSLKRISKDTPEKKIADKLKEQIEEATENIIHLYYEMELSILNNGYVSLELGKQVEISKAILSTCKRALGLPNPNEILFPQDFIEEYTVLLGRANKAIDSLTARIEKVSKFDDVDSFKTLLEKNLFTLKMLHSHYINSLGLPG